MTSICELFHLAENSHRLFQADVKRSGFNWSDSALVMVRAHIIDDILKALPYILDF